MCSIRDNFPETLAVMLIETVDVSPHARAQKMSNHQHF
jgi:hypothetical protein